MSPESAKLVLLDIRLHTPNTNGPFYAFNFYIANHGGSAAIGLVHHTSMAISERDLTPAELREHAISNNGEIDYWKIAPNSELEPQKPDDMISYYSFPDRPGTDAELLQSNLDDVVGSKKRLYFFNTLKYRDRVMRDDTLGITEWCIYFFANLVEPHDCGRRSFLEQSNPARSSK